MKTLLKDQRVKATKSLQVLLEKKKKKSTLNRLLDKIFIACLINFLTWKHNSMHPQLTQVL